MTALAKLGRGLVSTIALAGAAIAVVLSLRSSPHHPPRRAPPEPARPAPRVAAPSTPTRAVPCIAMSEHTTLRSLGDGEPGICNDTTCVVPTRDTVVAKPAMPDADRLPLAARIRLGDQPAACDADRCAPLGRRLAAAAAVESARAAPTLQATLDLSTAVVGRQMWSIARDIQLAPPRPSSEPNEDVLDIQVAGDLLIVHWRGECQRPGPIKPTCERSHMIDARGAVLGVVDADDGILRVGDRTFVTLSGDPGFTVYDLHTGEHIAHRDAPLTLGFAIAGRLATSREGPDRFAILRRIDNGILLEVFALALRELHSEGQRYYADCE